MIYKNVNITVNALQLEIAALLTGKGASLVGFVDISELPAVNSLSMSGAISIAAALDPCIVRNIVTGPTVQYYGEYRRANELLSTLCSETIRFFDDRGIGAVAIEPTVQKVDPVSLATTLPHKTAATRAGLGWVGKSDLLITRKYGAAVRLATVLCDIGFESGATENSSRCGECMECVLRCPASAITGSHWKVGQERDVVYNARACYDMAKRLSGGIGVKATICGICIAVCPWTKKYISAALETDG